jgi:hypothetical protein
MVMTNYGMPTIEEQREQCRRWREWLRDAGYGVMFMYTGEDEPFDREWQVYERADGDAKRIATFDYDGCGASWHGPDELWLKVIGPHEGVID